MIKSYIITLILCLLSSSCNSQKKNNIMDHLNINENSHILSDTEDRTSILSDLIRINNTGHRYKAGVSENVFFLLFSITNVSKKEKIYTNASYTMQVIPLDTSYTALYRLESMTFYDENHKNTGHASPNGKWNECDGIFTYILNYYLSNQEKIPVHSYEKVNVSAWNPIFCLADNESNQQHVIKLTRRNIASTANDAAFCLDTKVLSINNHLIDNKIVNYNISTSSYDYQLVGSEYYVKIKLNTSTTFMNEGKDSIEYQVPNTPEELLKVNEVKSARIILEYYFANRASVQVVEQPE